MTMTEVTFSLPRYFTRIRYTSEPRPTMASVAEMMRCQLFHIPFENLDVQAGKVISLQPADIVAKLVNRQRGGYCYEVNGLFAMALDALGIPYFFVAARPLTHGHRKPRTHMAIVVTLQGEKWLCDLGFGGHGIRAPMRLNLLETEVNQDGELFMLSMQSEHELLLKTHTSHGWEGLYAFELTPQHWEDFIPANFYNCTHHESIFVRKLLVVLCHASGRKILFGHTLKIITPGQEQKHHLKEEQLQRVLWEEFGVEGNEVG